MISQHHNKIYKGDPPMPRVRVTPHLFTSTSELDALVRALKELAAA
jgi:selenocysteine lyase/cysteine desulfurase